MDFKLKKSNLNFRVYTAASIPATGIENDICIVSEVPMSNWIMSPDNPSGTPRSDGDVWIQYSVTGNTFNALKTGAMIVAAISVWQYVDGVWAEVVAVSYQNGEWVDWWRGELYDNGKTLDIYSTGWNVVNNGGASSALQSDHILCTWHHSSGSNSNVTTNGKISFPCQKYTKLKMDIQVDSYIQVSNFPGIFGLRTSNSLCEATSAFSHYKTFTSTGRQTVELNLSGVKGDFYICTMVMFVGKIFKIWLEE